MRLDIKPYLCQICTVSGTARNVFTSPLWDLLFQEFSVSSALDFLNNEAVPGTPVKYLLSSIVPQYRCPVPDLTTFSPIRGLNSVGWAQTDSSARGQYTECPTKHAGASSPRKQPAQGYNLQAGS